MLSSELLRVKKKGNKILPSFASLDYENEYASSLLIDVYSEHVGKTLRELEEAVKEVEDQLEDLDYHPKFVRGLIELLNRAIVTERPATKVPSDVARRTVFSVSSEKGFAITDRDKAEIFSEAARKLGVTIEDLVKAFDASYEDSEVITDFKAPEPVDLLKQYNLSLLQTLMFKATSMTIIANMTGAEAKNLLRTIKRFGLMYTADREDGLLKIHVDGPASILTQTRRYGTRMAKVLPIVLHLKTWRIRADIIHTGKRYTLEIDERYSNLLPSKPPIEEEFDSFVEEEFMLKFRAFSMGWEIVREPEPLVVDGAVFIPDFALSKGDLKIYLEIVGFWTPSYIEKKLKKLSNVKDMMIVAVDRKLSCTKGVSLTLKGSPNIELVTFEDKLKLSDVLPVLRELEKRKAVAIREESLPRLADEEELRMYLSKIEEEPLKRVLEVLKGFDIQDMHEVQRILRKHGLVIVWKSLDQSEAIVKRLYR
jgi:predicted nuclease of restriction endonuclease-like RecB superfamily